MGIKQSVGRNGKNNRLDVKVVQAALNLVAHNNFQAAQKLIIDGRCGKKTSDAIELFQKNVLAITSPDGRVDPNDVTLKALHLHINKKLSEEALVAIMGHGGVARVKLYFTLMSRAFTKYQINTPLRNAHFLAQIGHESLSFIYTEETASGIAYEGRQDLGNTQKGDGKRFKGRGLIQLTGRANYTSYSQYSGLDLLKLGNETIVSKKPFYALDVSLWFWTSKKLNRYADQDNIRAITRRVNGGFNGIRDRQDYLNRAKFFLL